MISVELLDLLCCPECNSSLRDINRQLSCEKCGVKIPVIANIPRFWGTTEREIIEFDEAGVRDPQHWTGWRRRNYEFFHRNLKGVKKSSILIDIGAGTSPFCDILRPWKNFKVDFEPYKGIDFLTDLNKALPVSDKAFDVIIMSNVLEHIAEPLRLLLECKRVLRLGGQLILTVPFLIKVHQAPYDFLRYTEYMLERLLTQADFEQFRIESIGNIFDVYAQIVSSIYKFIANERGSNKRSRRMFFSFLERIHKGCMRVLVAALCPDEVYKKDKIGYPHGYGCVAIRTH